ncbi:MAG: hypothetical protein H0U48_08625 [Euzebyaceae bacterium]|nr:hypothetical protein [Euzebyaceae bacterium]
MRRILIAALVMAGTLVPAIGLPPAAHAADSEGVRIRLLEAPVELRDDPRARTYVVDHLQPGDEISRRIEVANFTDAPTQVALYAAGAIITRGTFRGLEGREANELSEWTTVTPSSVDLAPGEAAEATVAVDIPRKVFGGERYGVVWAELPGSQSQSGVTTVNRVGIRMYLSVGGPKEPPSDFTVDELVARRADAGNPIVSATVTNTGERALDLQGELVLTKGPGGLGAGPFPADVGTTIGPGDTAPVDVALDDSLPNGPWTVRVTLRSGNLERKVRGEITFPTAGAAAPVTVQPAGPTWWLWALLGLLALLLLGVLWWLLARRRRRHAEDSEADTAQPAARPQAADLTLRR